MVVGQNHHVLMLQKIIMSSQLLRIFKTCDHDVHFPGEWAHHYEIHFERKHREAEHSYSFHHIQLKNKILHIWHSMLYTLLPLFSCGYIIHLTYMIKAKPVVLKLEFWTRNIKAILIYQFDHDSQYHLQV